MIAIPRIAPPENIYHNFIGSGQNIFHLSFSTECEVIITYFSRTKFMSLVLIGLIRLVCFGVRRGT